MKIRLRIRAWKNGNLAIDERVEVNSDELKNIGSRHGQALAGSSHCVEIEFLDEPDPLQRFLRFGTDPRYMVRPQQIELIETARYPE